MKTCSTCKHWNKQARPMVQVPGVGQAPDMSVPVMGECREQLRTLVQASANGPLISPYYAMTPEGWSACGQYEEQETICGGIPIVKATGKEAEKLAEMGTPIFGRL